MLDSKLEKLSLGCTDRDCCKSQSSAVRLGNGFHYLSTLDYTDLPKPLPPSIEIRVSPGVATAQNEDLLNSLPLLAAASPLLKMKMLNLQRLTTGDSKVVYQAELIHEARDNSSWFPLTITAGDSVAIQCQNSRRDVDWLLSRINYGEDVQSPDSPFTVEAATSSTRAGKKAPAWLLPSHTVTARFLLTYCCELHTPVTRRMLRLLADCCQESDDGRDQAKCMLSFSSNQSQNFFHKYIRQTDMTFMDLLATFPACRPTLASLLELLPFLQPRAYSLLDCCCDAVDPTSRSASSPRQRQHLSFAFTRVDFDLEVEEESASGLVRYPHRRHGVCSSWLERLWRLEPDSRTVSVYLRKSLGGFHLPEDNRVPVVMVAAGTGVAPFVCFLRRRRLERRREDEIPDDKQPFLGGNTFGPMWLIFGCRSPKTSLLFAEDMSHSLRDGILDTCCLCFSRYTKSTREEKKQESADLPLALDSLSCCHWDARYVQECILEECEASASHQRRLAELLLERKAVVYVCGENKRMVPAVREAFSSLISTYLHCKDGSNSSGIKYMNEMKRDKRYLEEIWA